MSKKELRCVLNFIKEQGACHESVVWHKFMKNESGHEQIRVKWIVEDLSMKGLIQHAYNKEGHCIVKYVMNSYQ